MPVNEGFFGDGLWADELDIPTGLRSWLPHWKTCLSGSSTHVLACAACMPLPLALVFALGFHAQTLFYGTARASQ